MAGRTGLQRPVCGTPGSVKVSRYKPKRTPIDQSTPLTDNDFDLDFEQKGVDLKIGLDIASYCENRHADRVVLVSNDTDCVPAIKYGRKSGMQVVVAELPNCEIARSCLCIPILSAAFHGPRISPSTTVL